MVIHGCGATSRWPHVSHLRLVLNNIHHLTNQSASVTNRKTLYRFLLNDGGWGGGEVHKGAYIFLFQVKEMIDGFIHVLRATDDRHLVWVGSSALRKPEINLKITSCVKTGAVRVENLNCVEKLYLKSSKPVVPNLLCSEVVKMAIICTYVCINE